MKNPVHYYNENLIFFKLLTMGAFKVYLLQNNQTHDTSY